MMFAGAKYNDFMQKKLYMLNALGSTLFNNNKDNHKSQNK